MRLIGLFLLLFSSTSYSQVQISFLPTWNKQAFQLGDTLKITTDQQIRFDTYRFYLSDLTFYQDSKLVYTDTEKAHLLDLAFDSTLQFSIPNLIPNSYNSISFRFGIDSTTNVSGAMSGDLDPMYGMYWSWQSGYINCKLEGELIGEQSSSFQYHLGGYLPPFDASTKIQLTCDQTSKLSLDLSTIFSQILTEKSKANIMSPCSQAVGMAHALAHSFYFTK